MWKDTFSQQAKEHPGRIVAMALGAGFLLGGGLFSRLTARILGIGLRIGLRVAVVPVVTQRIVTLAAEGLSSRTDHNSDEDAHHNHDDHDATGPRGRRGGHVAGKKAAPERRPP